MNTTEFSVSLRKEGAEDSQSNRQEHGPYGAHFIWPMEWSGPCPRRAGMSYPSWWPNPFVPPGTPDCAGCGYPWLKHGQNGLCPVLVDGKRAQYDGSGGLMEGKLEDHTPQSGNAASAERLGQTVAGAALAKAQELDPFDDLGAGVYETSDGAWWYSDTPALPTPKKAPAASVIDSQTKAGGLIDPRLEDTELQ